MSPSTRIPDVVAAAGVMHTVREHQCKREHTKTDDDGSQNERLGYRVRKWRLQRLIAGWNHGWRCACEPARGEDQDIGAVREQPQTDDELRQASPQQQINAGRV